MGQAGVMVTLEEAIIRKDCGTPVLWGVAYRAEITAMLTVAAVPFPDT